MTAQTMRIRFNQRLQSLTSRLGVLLALACTLPVLAQPIDPGLFSRATVSGSMCLDAWNGPAEWRKLVITTCWGNANQDFRLINVPGKQGFSFIRLDKFCVVASTGNLNGSDLKLMTCDEKNPAQWWEVINSAHHPESGRLNASFRFANKCIDVAGNPSGLAVGKTLDVHMWDCNGQLNQSWGYDARPR